VNPRCFGTLRIVYIEGRFDSSFMKAARMLDYGKPLSIEQVDIPKLADPTGVIVKISGCGFCHSDLRVITGERRFTFALPYILGHENSGYVHEIGTDDTGFKAGDPVLVYGGWGCRRCQVCNSGNEQLCDKPRWPCLSEEYHGGFAEYLYVPTSRYLIKVEDEATDVASLAPLTDAALTSYHAVKKARSLIGTSSSSSSNVVVIGIGGLGVYALQFLKLLTASSTIAIDAVEQKLALAQKLGASFTGLSQSPGLADEIMRQTRRVGADAVIDFVANKSSIDLALKVLKKQGAYVAVGLGGGKMDIPAATLIRNETLLAGSRWGSYRELVEVYEYYKAGKLQVLSQKRRLEEINDVAEEMKRGEIEGRAVLLP
jgi:D-arabinose 1-dehydrogenase-like Zn-dependent alcohol dehydrogenase